MTTNLSPEQQVQRLRSQIGWITRLSASLSSTQEGGDILSLMLTGFVSPGCLGYSQVLYLTYDNAHKTFHGHCALHHESREDYEKLAEELEKETTFVKERSEGSDVSISNVLSATNSDREELSWLLSNTQWVVLSQRLSTKNPVTKRLEKTCFGQSGLDGTFMERILQWRTSKAVDRNTLKSPIPEILEPFLPEFFAVCPLHSFQGLRGLVIVDRRLDPDPRFSEEHLTELDWFCRQAALALENAEMNADMARTYEDLKQLDLMKSNFLSIISHELRTPLTSMSGFVELILDEKVGPINDNQRTLLTRVSKNTGHLVHLVNDLIEVAQTKAEGTMEVEMGPVDPLNVLMNTLPKLEQRRRETNVEIEPKLNFNSVPRVLTDERAFGRILFHLLDNALKFSQPGGSVEVRFRVEDDEFLVDVADKGVGIPKEKIKLIFDHFYQVDGSLTRSYEGLGLGLAVTRILAQACRARILVKTEEGKGSTFTVVFPLYDHRTVPSDSL